MAETRARHGDHDPELVAALLDHPTDATESDLAPARGWIATCADCAALHADLVALTVATRVLPTPSRARDFRLTAADAARLASAPATPAREPSPAAPRLTGVMHDTRDHASHDTLLVASLADRSVAERERSAAEAIIATCGLCATLHADLVALSIATRDLPSPKRIRDFRLSPDDAVRLRPTGWRRLVAAFGSSGDVFSRPLAMGLTTLGIAGLLAASVPSIFSGMAASPAAGERSAVSQAAGGAAVPSGAPVAPISAPAASDAAAFASGAPAALESREVTAEGADRLVDVTNGIDPKDELYAATDGADPDPAGLAPDPSGFSAIVVVSGTLLIVGLGLFALRWTARRFGD